jgi:MOSC domain-containing protein YiiM
MKLLSIQIGRPREIQLKHHTITTSFYKEPIPGPVKVKTLGLEGDTQSDLRVHGGPNKAVYAYSADAYPDPQSFKAFEALNRPGMYFRVLREGEIAIGQTLKSKFDI